LLALFILLTTAFVFTSCEKDKDDTISVTGVTLNESSATIKVGGTLTLTETVDPLNATEKEVTWTSSNSNVASVADGVVTGVSVGLANITVTTKDGNKTATCQVTVTANGNDDDKPKVYVLDISELVSDWHYMVVGSDGSSMFINVDEKTNIPTRLFLKPDNNSDNGFTFLFKENGLPDMMIHDGHILYFGNFRENKFDLAIIYPDNKIEYFYDIEADGDWDAITLRSGSNADFLTYIGDAVGIATCLASPYFLPAIKYCGAFLLGKVGHLAVDIILPEGFFRDLGHVFVDVYGCAGNRTDPNTAVSCATALARNAHLLSYIDFSLTNEKSAFIILAKRTLEGDETHTGGPGVYVAGFEFNAQGRTVAKLWKDGVAQDLTDGTYNAEARSVYVSGNDVFVAGYIRKTSNSPTVAILWKNGVAQQLTDGTEYEQAYSVFVSDGDVYVAGRYQTWKNGKLLYNNGGNSIFVSGNDVYVAGGGNLYVFGPGEKGPGGDSRVWKNGVVQSGYSSGTAAHSVFVSGSNVYVAGQLSYYDMDAISARLWINGVQQRRQLSVIYFEQENNYAAAHSIFVSGNDIYVAGKYGGYLERRAVLWINHRAVNLSVSGSNWAEGNSVFVADGDVYVAGKHGNFAMLWINGVGFGLTDGKRGAGANSVFVVK